MHDRSISNFPSCWIQWTALWSAGAFKCNNLAVNFQKTSVNETSLNPARNRSRQEPVLESAENDDWSTLFILVHIFFQVYFGTDMKWIRCSFAYIMGEAVDINTVISCILMSWWCSQQQRVVCGLLPDSVYCKWESAAECCDGGPYMMIVLPHYKMYLLCSGVWTFEVGVKSKLTPFTFIMHILYAFPFPLTLLRLCGYLDNVKW